MYYVLSMVSIDETTYIEGHYFANVLVGTLKIDRPRKRFLINSDELE